ncbi:MAG: S24 family peptidase [Gammaproteobacteria bacterium]|nr:S24 family peptidase [Gammaproteobacteria bacterium]MDP2346838.1 S24 family peptidase [Gammaproteobacteria bacterium]
MQTWNQRLDQAIKDSSHNKSSLARAIGVSAPTVTDWTKGEIQKITADNAEKVCKELGINIQWLLSGKGKIREAAGLSGVSAEESGAGTIMVPRLNVAGSMGLGRSQPEGYIEVIERMTLNIDYLRRNLTFSGVANLAVITGYGDSMEGTFADGDLLLVDRGVNEIRIDAVYVLSLADELYIKRIQRRPNGTYLMLSDNHKYPPYEIKNGEAERFQVLARVLLAWNAKRL